MATGSWGTCVSLPHRARPSRPAAGSSVRGSEGDSGKEIRLRAWHSAVTGGNGDENGRSHGGPGEPVGCALGVRPALGSSAGMVGRSAGGRPLGTNSPGCAQRIPRSVWGRGKPQRTHQERAQGPMPNTLLVLPERHLEDRVWVRRMTAAIDHAGALHTCLHVREVVVELRVEPAQELEPGCLSGQRKQGRPAI